MVEFGVVQSISQRRGRESGIVAVTDPTGERILLSQRRRQEVQFRYASWEKIGHTNNSPAFDGKGHRPPRVPERNDVLVFERRVRDGQTFCQPWAYAEHWHAMADRLANRPTYAVVRHQIQTRLPADSQPSPQVLCTGIDALEVSCRFPLTELELPADGTYANRTILGYRVRNNGTLIIMEELMLMQDGQQVPCPDDPRTPLCCVPSRSFRRHMPPGTQQPDCGHLAA